MEYSTYWAKAAESLATAELCLERDWYNSCANRCYYAMFQSAIAVLIGLRATPVEHWTHKYVAASVAGYLVKQRKLLPSRFGALYREVENTRHKGDYDPMSVTQREASKALRIAQEFVAILREAME